MTILILGLAMFLGIHLLPVLAGLRDALYDRLGEKGYKGMFSAVSAIGLVLIVIGYARAPSAPLLFQPFRAAILLAPLAMIISFVLFASANMRTHIRRRLKHPMLLGLGLWSGVHLLANGELRATLLFGAFLAYAAIDLLSAVQRNAIKTFAPVARQDMMAVGGGIVLALLVMAFHRHLFGVPAVHWGL
ncbi:MAG TPA: NnrU family protein [Noviherbaspirillum sp.]|uniref:NnrU family protein n=1 Tax=Noviherbaspirillum sp. TaxID=1926288 RepID=UPI002D62104F|nr:NnrU family protein [Noviherbaspirillum sp.]HYD97008.1 NnrU family protein [Noviherbaspirillum sp.]